MDGRGEGVQLHPGDGDSSDYLLLLYCTKMYKNDMWSLSVYRLFAWIHVSECLS